MPRTERFIEKNVNGRAPFHRIHVLEANGGQGENRAKIDLRALTEARHPESILDERLGLGNAAYTGRDGGAAASTWKAAFHMLAADVELAPPANER